MSAKESLVDARGRSLDLAEPAASAARMLKREFPRVVFTSGRRSREEQAGAMASNVIANPKLIQQTYRDSEPARACQKWVDAHINTRTLRGIAEGLASVMGTFTDSELTALSKHLSGLAFDVQPVGGHLGELIKARIRTLPGLVRFLDREGGLIRWHAQF